ncbi:MAG TPA: hypothetical protein VMX97_05475 [Hyphomicrobiaceae bacterium]|nr:hypothetical protein [Hyphomicrobiaceae bacterium]
MPQSAPPTAAKPWRRIILLASLLGILLIAGQWGGSRIGELVRQQIGTGANAQFVVIIALAIYIVLLALPFVPGIEISVALLALFGSAVAIPIYVASIMALTLSYLAGRLIPPKILGAWFGFFGLRNAKALIEKLAPMSTAQRLATLTETTPGKLLPKLIKYREVALVLAMNIPGNAIIGGGGGIAMLVGSSGLISLPRFLLALAIAVLPIPLFTLLAAR